MRTPANLVIRNFRDRGAAARGRFCFDIAAAPPAPLPRPKIPAREARLIVEKVTRDTQALLPAEVRPANLGCLVLIMLREKADIE